MKKSHSIKLILTTIALTSTQLFGNSLNVLSDSAVPFLTTPFFFGGPPAITLPQDGGSGVTNVGSTSLGSANPGTSLSNAVFVFQLPSLGAVATPFLTANFTVAVAGIGGFGNPFNSNPTVNNYDLYGLGARTSPTVLASDFYAGTNDTTNATKLVENLPGTTTPQVGSVFTNSITSYLNNQYAGGAGAGNYIFLRINPDFNPNTFSTLDWSANTTQTFITYTVPEPTTFALVAGLGAVIGLRRTRTRKP